MHQPWRTFIAIINRCIFRKSLGLDRLSKKFKKVASPSKKLSLILEEESIEKPKRAKKPAKKSTTVPTSCVVIRDTPASQLKKTLKKSKQKTHKLHASGSGDEVGSQPKVPDKHQERQLGNSEDDDSNDDESDDVSNDDDDVDSDADGDNEASDGEKTYSDEDENPNLNQNDDDEDEYVRTPDNYEFIDGEEEYEEFYKDVNVRLRDIEHGEEGKEDAEKTDVEQVKDDKHVILTTIHDTQETAFPLKNVRHEEPSTQTPPFLTIQVTVIPETSSAAASTIPSSIPPFNPISQTSRLTPTTTTKTTTTSIPALPDFSSLFGFDQRVSVLEKELLQLKQVDYSTQLLE
nr:hypothetical protein [Tanacetum cinerariifolium]